MGKMASVDSDSGIGSRLSCLSSQEASKLIKKYHKIIKYKCQKYSFLNTHSVEDLVQEC
jgi:hypothetical protein